MDAPDRIEARARGVALIAQLFDIGLDEAGLATWRDVPAAGVLLPPVFDPDEAAAHHVRVTEFEVPPYGALFLSPDGLLGGATTEAAARSRADLGLGPLSHPDHLPAQLRQYLWLLLAERDAEADGVRSPAVITHTQHLLDEQLLRWLPVFTAALRTLPKAGIYSLAADLALELVVTHRSSLPNPPPPWVLPPSPTDLLDDPKTGLARIARHLAIPSRVGGYLARGTLQQIGRELELPVGFGSRWQMIEGLFASAAHYGQVPVLVGRLETVMDTWSATYRGVDAGGTGPVCAPWQERLLDTRGLLRRMAVAADSAREVVVTG